MTSNSLPRVGILGAGNVGCAIAIALLENDYPVDNISISTRQPDRIPKCKALESPYHQRLYQTIPRYYDNARLSKSSDIIILCIPPSQLKSVAIQIKHALGVAESPTVLFSTLCGATTETIQKECGSKMVMRIQVAMNKLMDANTACDARKKNEVVAMELNPSTLAIQQLGSHMMSFRHILKGILLRLGANEEEITSRIESILFGNNDELFIQPPKQSTHTWSKTWTATLHHLQTQLSIQE